MELLSRATGDQLLRPGHQTDIRRRLRALAPRHNLATVIVCAFDHRTRMLPFFYADLRMAPAGVRAIGSALVDSGFEKTRIVLQQWNKNVRPTQMRLDGRLPDLLLISSMSLHTAACKELIRDVCRIEPDRRPLVIAGGSLCIYEPWEVFSVPPPTARTQTVVPTPSSAYGQQAIPDCRRGRRHHWPENSGTPPASADVAVTGEEYVLLELLELLLSGRHGQEPLRQTFANARASGALDAIPGLIYPRLNPDGTVAELVNTGIQRLLGDLDELAFPTAGYGILEAPSRRPTLAARPVPASQVRKYTPISSLSITFGCRFSCDYCPIPAYNQKNLRGKSGPRITAEIHRLYRDYGIRYYFGTDDNFLADRDRALDILETLAKFEFDGTRLARKIRWGTEVTVHDTLLLREHLPTLHDAGVRALWLGVEDMTGTLVRKGQSVDKTLEVFRLLRQHGICPMPMMMHHDAQPLYTRGRPAGLLNQISLLRKAGAVSLQVLMLTPSAGSKNYEKPYTSGMVYQSAGGRRVEPYMYDGNYVIATAAPKPWRKQLNLMVAYAFFYNPLHLLGDLIHHRTRVSFKPAGMQLVGMWGLFHTLRRTLGWSLRLRFTRTTRRLDPPGSPLPMRTLGIEPPTKN